jgi:lipid II:glycine glycyltransferase (peptidoglycan interpeptide bridge formation enzyme)
MTGQIDVRVSEKERDPDWDAFVASVPCGHHVQTSLWGQVKATLGYRTKRVIAQDNGQIVAGGQILVRRLIPFVTIGYMPKGPVYPAGDLSLGENILDKLKRIVQTDHFQLLTVQPANDNSELPELFTGRGFRSSWLELAPTATILLDLAPDREQILAQMKRQTRQNIRRSEREGMTVREGTVADLPAFYQLHLMTSQRQKFKPYPEKYFARMWQVFSTQGLTSLILAEYQGTAVSALLLVLFGDTVIAKTLGWSGQYAERRPNDAVFWASIQWAKSHGYRCFDFEGIDRKGAELLVSGQPLPEELQHTPDFIKLGYGGKVALMPQSYYFVPSPLFRWPYHKVFGLRERSPAIKELLEDFIRRFG